MLGLLAPSAAALIVAVALRGPRLCWSSTTIRWWPAALAVLAIELLIYNPPLDEQAWVMLAGPWIWVGTKLVLLAVVGRNAFASTRTSPALWLAAFGIALNTVVIAANGGYMPQSTEAAITVWGKSHVVSRRAEPRLRNVTPITDDSRLQPLADVIPQPTWLPRANVVSVGDVALALGVGWWVLLSLVPAAVTRRY
jgi:hypothetical protein